MFRAIFQKNNVDVDFIYVKCNFKYLSLVSVKKMANSSSVRSSNSSRFCQICSARSSTLTVRHRSRIQVFGSFVKIFVRPEKCSARSSGGLFVFVRTLGGWSTGQGSS